MCVFCSQRGRSPDHGPDEIAPGLFDAFPLDGGAVELTGSRDDGNSDSAIPPAFWALGDPNQDISDDTGPIEGTTSALPSPAAPSDKGANDTPGAFNALTVDENGQNIPSTTATRAIDWGTKENSTSITYFFREPGYYDFIEDVTSESWNAYERAQFRKAFDLIESVTNLTFINSNTSAADFELIADTNELDNLGFFNPPRTLNAGTGVFAVDQWDRFSGGELEVGGFGFTTITHELLHGLGLAHPHDRGGSSSIMSGVTSDFDDTGLHFLNQGIFTTMSYNPGFYEGPVGTESPSFRYGQEVGPMALDIAVLQRKYGANVTTALGDDVYDLPDANQTGTYYKAIWDAGGNDMIRYSGTRATTLDLRPATLENDEGGGGYVSAATSIAGGYTIAYGVEIENAESGSGNDELHGNDVANQLTARGGDDTIMAYAGDDTIKAGGGNDDVQGLAGDDSISGGGGKDTLYGGTENDTILGGNGGDKLLGQNQDDLIAGGGGYDNIKGGGGDDTIKGGNGNDTVTGGTGNDNIKGGNQNDKLAGETGNDTLKGGNGADTFIFDLRHGQDVIQDFSLAEDVLQISLNLSWGMNAQGIEDAAVLESNGDVEIDFGHGDVITLNGLGTTDGLAEIISIV